MWCWGAGALFLLHQCIILHSDLRCRRSRYHGGERRTRVGSRYRVVLGSRGTVLTSSVYHCTFRFEMSKEPISWRGAENMSRKQISCGAGEQGHCSYFISVRQYLLSLLVYIKILVFLFIAKLLNDFAIEPEQAFSILLFSSKRTVMIRREICPIRADISTHKHGEKLYISYLYD